MKTSDEDLEVVTACLAAFVTRDGSALLGDAIVKELRALRKAADAADALLELVVFTEDIDDIVDSVEYADLGEALKEAGL